MSSTPAEPRDVIFTLFGISWAAAVARGFIMPEDRLARELTEHPAVRRLLLCDPYRSFAGKANALVRRREEARLPASTTQRLWSPLRLRRTDPVAPERFVARYERGMRRIAESMGMERPAIITVHPLVAGFGEFDWAGPVTYYGWDDWTASVPHRRWWPAYDEAFARLRARGRRACAISEDALRRIAPTGPSAVIPNGIEPEEWRTLAPPPAWFEERPHPRLLYAGSLDSRVDAAQAQQVAEAYPDGSLTLIGRLIEPEHFAALRALGNVAVSPLLGRAEITSIIAAADVCLIPHVRNPLTEAMSPLKLYEYLAGGRPVAAVDLPPIAGVPGRVALAPPGGDLRPAVAKALELGPAPEEERLAFVAEHAWSRRFERLLELALS
jgi:glycosyltransferase involved in cell wall biosynthesis